MNHAFNVQIAVKLGLSKAILLENMNFWLDKNVKNENNFYDGEYWTYNSTKAFNELFPYMSESSIKKNLKQLQEDGYLLVGNYNKSKFDRTKWYAFTSITKELFEWTKIVPSERIKIVQCKEEKVTNNTIYNPDIKKNINKKEKYLSVFESLWSKYPKKTKKQDISNSITNLKKVYDKKEDIEKALNNYINDPDLEINNGWRKCMDGGRFFKKGYLDYLEAPQPVQQNDGYRNFNLDEIYNEKEVDFLDKEED